MGYFYALIIAIGLFPVTKALFGKYFDASLYLQCLAFLSLL